MRENMYESKQKYWYIYDLVDALNNHTKFHVLSVKVKENVTTVCHLHQKQKLKTPLWYATQKVTQETIQTSVSLRKFSLSTCIPKQKYMIQLTLLLTFQLQAGPKGGGWLNCSILLKSWRPAKAAPYHCSFSLSVRERVIWQQVHWKVHFGVTVLGYSGAGFVCVCVCVCVYVFVMCVCMCVRQRERRRERERELFENTYNTCQTHDRKVESSNPGRSSVRIFFSTVSFVSWLLFGVCFTPALLQWLVDNPSHSAKSAGGRLHLNMHTLDPTKSERADYATVQAQCGNLSGNELICNLSGNIWPQSPQPAEPLWTDPGIKSEFSVRELIST